MMICSRKNSPYVTVQIVCCILDSRTLASMFPSVAGKTPGDCASAWAVGKNHIFCDLPGDLGLLRMPLHFQQFPATDGGKSRD